MKNKSIKIILLILLACTWIQACKDDDNEEPTATGATYDGTPYQLLVGDFEQPPIAMDNKLTIQGVKLGRMLFYEKALSKDGSMACASCHLQEDGFSDSDQFSEGVDGLFGARQAMAVVNLAWNENGFFWDGRAELLRHQSVLPIQDPLEMNETIENVIAKLETKELLKNKSVLLVDDVITTGATIEACATALKEAENVTIYVAVMAIVP